MAATPKSAKWTDVPLPGDVNACSTQFCPPTPYHAAWPMNYTMPYSPYMACTPCFSPKMTPLPGASPMVLMTPLVAPASPWMGSPVSAATPFQSTACLNPLVQVHPVLSRASHDGSPTSLQWDITQPPSTAQWTTQRNVTVSTGGLFAEEAITPHNFTTLYISLTPDLDPIRRLLTKKRAESDPDAEDIRVTCEEGKSITVGDLLEAIHAFFLAPLTGEEFKDLVTDGGLGSGVNTQTVLSAAHSRISRCTTNNKETERRAGYRRADLLTGRWAFGSLNVKYGMQGTWWLELALGPS